jgi:tripartite motif-containing protein 2/3
MAERVLKQLEEQLEEQLNCSICLDTYTDPKLLQCFHVYCQKCLVPLVVQDQQRKLGLTCRQLTPISDKGVAGLRPAFHINHLLEMINSLPMPEKPAATSESDVDPIKKTSHCLVHEGKELELYCETCKELICLKCVIKGGKHRNHDYKEFNQACEKYKVDH